jgi:hypothetical protein
MRPLIPTALATVVLVAGCGGDKTAAEQPPTTTAISTATSATTTTAPTTTTEAPMAPPEAPPVPANLPDEFLVLHDGRIVKLDGSEVGRIKGFQPRSSKAFTVKGSDAVWTFEDGKIVPAHPQRWNLRLKGKAHACQTLGYATSGALISCYWGTSGLYVRKSGGDAHLLVPLPKDDLGGHWEYAYPSPDGSRLLLGYSGECEIPIAFFAPATGGTAVPVTGESDWNDAPLSIALGWTKDGRALAYFMRQGCGEGTDPAGVYAVAADGSRTLVSKADYAAFFRS